jgi:hypothetical protein
MSVVSYDWLPLQNPSRPQTVAISVVFHGFLGELAVNGLDISAVIANVKAACVAVANASVGVLSIAALTSACAAIVGVLEIDSVEINLDSVDLPGANFWTAMQYIDVAVKTVV